jgi:uncharacterized protein (TIGR03435 family)
VRRLVLAIALTSSGLYAQTPLAFEAASIKPAAAGLRSGGHTIAPGGERYLATNTGLRLLIADAYRVRLDLITGGPDWIDRERYDLIATAGRPCRPAEIRAMLQTLLAERFHLQLHRATHELPAYVLTVDAAPKLAPAADSAFAFDQFPGKPHQVNMRAKAVPMDYFAWRLGRVLDKLVVDQTNLTGIFDFELAFMEEVDPEILARIPYDQHPSIFEALRQQLGLKLTPRKAPVEVIAIDGAERPTAN